MTEVREITRSELSCARSVIKASVIPSEKYSCDASPVRFSKGSTAMARMAGARPGLTMWRSESRQLNADRATAMSTPVIKTPNDHPRNLENSPFPVSIAKNASGAWYFDTESGKQEVLYRRVGTNENDGIEICYALVGAQREY